MMPTAGKLMAATVFGVGGYIMAETVRPLLPEGTLTGKLTITCILLPIIVAWRTLGRRVGQGYSAALNSGIYAVFVSVVSVFFAFSAAEMLRRSMKLRYDGPMEAITDIFGIVIEYSVILTSPNIWIGLAGIAVVGGLVSEWALRRWQ